MSGLVPDFIKKEKNVLYEGKLVKVLDWHFTCPCAIGNTNHHPTDDLLMVHLEGVGYKPFSWETFAEAK